MDGVDARDQGSIFYIAIAGWKPAHGVVTAAGDSRISAHPAYSGDPLEFEDESKLYFSNTAGLSTRPCGRRTMWDDQPSALILEGAPGFREVLREALAELGISAHTAGTWEEARDFLREPGHRFSVGIVDVDLPGKPCQSIIGGFPLLAGGRWPIFLTCEEPPSRDEVEKAHRQGIIGYLHRAADLHENAFRVQAYLEGRLATAYLSAPRARILAPVQIAPKDSEDDRPLLGLVRNISRGGMLVSMVSAPPEESRVSLCFQLPPRSSAIRCEGRIVWREAHHGMMGSTVAGIEFETLEAEDKEFIHRLVLGMLRESSGKVR